MLRLKLGLLRRVDVDVVGWLVTGKAALMEDYET